MQSAALSIIIPMRDIENEIGGILRFAASQAAGTDFELIVVDMGSGDRSVLEALQLIKDSKLRGCVVQNGQDAVSSALNTGIQKAAGQYVTFLFPRRLYRNILDGYMKTGLKTNADIVFGCVGETEARIAEKRLNHPAFRQPSGAEIASGLILGGVHMDIGAVLLRRAFLISHQISFNESCGYGYAEEFIFRCLLFEPNVCQSPAILLRDTIYELKGSTVQPAGFACFELIDSMLRVYDIVLARHKNDKRLVSLFEQQKLPETILKCVELLLSDGAGYNAVRGYLKVKGYAKYLATGHATSADLKRRMIIWKTIPWMYKTKK